MTYLFSVLILSALSVWIRSPLLLCVVYLGIAAVAIRRWIKTRRHVRAGHANILEVVWFTGNGRLRELDPFLDRMDDQGMIPFTRTEVESLRRFPIFTVAIGLLVFAAVSAAVGTIFTLQERPRDGWLPGSIAAACFWAGIVGPSLAAVRLYLALQRPQE